MPPRPPRRQDNVICPWLKIRVEVRAPGTSQEHLLLVHDSVDATTLVKRVHCIIFLSVGHRTEQHGYCAGVRTIDCFTQVFHDIVVLYRAFGEFPCRPALRGVRIMSSAPG